MNSQNDEGCGNLEIRKLPQCGCLVHDKMMNPISSMNCLQTQKSIKHQYAKQERDQMLPKVSPIKENIVTTILQPIYKNLSK